ncbi:MAG: hypothetical protein ACK559_03745, partial [bacterium]
MFAVEVSIHRSKSAVARGNPCRATANPPTSRKSTRCFVSNLKNSRKSSDDRCSSITGLPAELKRAESLLIGLVQPEVGVRIDLI